MVAGINDLPEVLLSDSTGQRRLVLVVSEVCVGGYGTAKARSRSARGEERITVRSEAGAAVGVAKEKPLRPAP